ncbi:MAG TPA: thymidine phosphorylase, partial [Aestuariivirga sp.]|nr:thymidine phosphorylase [Aestuariivirga sp.]
DRLHRVTLALGAELLVAAGLHPDAATAEQRLLVTLSSGEAAERFQKMVTLLGGPGDFISRAAHHLPQAPIIRPVHAAESGTVERIDTRQLGLAVIELGGGRRITSDRIDPAVGLTQLAGKGAAVDAATPLALVHARDEAGFARAADIVRAAYHLGMAPPHQSPIVERVGVP